MRINWKIRLQNKAFWVAAIPAVLLVVQALLGLLGMLAVNLFYYNGLSQLKAQQAFIINYLWPILIVLFSCLLLGERVIARLNCVAAGDVPRPGFIEGLYRIMHNWR